MYTAPPGGILVKPGSTPGDGGAIFPDLLLRIFRDSRLFSNLFVWRGR